MFTLLFSASMGDFEWVEILYSLAGTLVGFLLPIVAGWFIGRSQEARRLETIRKTIKSELTDIMKSLCDIHKDDLDRGQPPYISQTLEAECIVWDSVKSSDIFIELIHKHNEEYSKLITIYNQLVYLNKYEDKYDNIVMHNSAADRESVIASIRRLRVAILKNIKEYLDCYDKS
jgi:hypothetical protein